MDHTEYYLGIDPAWKTCAVALMNDRNEVIKSIVLDPSTMEMAEVPDVVEAWLGGGFHQIIGCCMERFVYYEGVHNPDSERILMVIGQLQYWLRTKNIPCTLWRAYDWKSRLSKHLFKERDFRNPSDRFDKVFSVAAAECCTGVKFETDHEADAGCLAYLAGAMYA